MRSTRPRARSRNTRRRKGVVWRPRIRRTDALEAGADRGLSERGADGSDHVQQILDQVIGGNAEQFRVERNYFRRSIAFGDQREMIFDAINTDKIAVQFGGQACDEAACQRSGESSVWKQSRISRTRALRRSRLTARAPAQGGRHPVLSHGPRPASSSRPPSAGGIVDRPRRDRIQNSAAARRRAGRRVGTMSSVGRRLAGGRPAASHFRADAR